MSDVSVIPLGSVSDIKLPNESWTRMLVTRERVKGAATSLGYSVFTPGTELQYVSHATEEVAFVVRGRGRLCLDEAEVRFAGGDAIHIPAGVWHAVVNDGNEEAVMVFGFPYPAYPPTERR